MSNNQLDDLLDEDSISSSNSSNIKSILKRPLTNIDKLKQQHPELDIRIVFQSANTKIRKGSKTTYGMFCDKHGIVWAEKNVPESWLKA